MLVVFAFMLPLILLLSWFTQSQFNQRLHEYTVQNRDLESARIERVFQQTLNDRRKELLQIRSALELEQTEVLNHLLTQSFFERHRIIVINHHGEVKPLLPQNRQADSTTRSLVEQLTPPLQELTFQFDEKGFIRLNHSDFAAVALPLKHRQWRGMLLVESISDNDYQRLMQAYETLKSAQLVGIAADAPTNTTIPTLFGPKLELKLVFKQEYVAQFADQTTMLFAQIVSLVLLALLILYILQHRLVIGPLKRFTEGLSQASSEEQHRQLLEGGSPELRRLAEDCNGLFLQSAHHQRQRDALLRAISDAVIVVDANGEIELINNAAESLLGVTHRSAFGHRMQQVLNDKSGIKLDSDLIYLLHGDGTSIDGEIRLKRGEVIKYSCVKTLDENGQTQGAVMVLRDMTRDIYIKRQLQQRAQQDSITKLFNRQVFERELEGLAKKGGQHAVCFMNLNRFKIINDSCGHTAGDRMLADVAAEMMQHVRPQDTLARIGGDEFGLIMPDTSALEVAKILKSVSERVHSITLFWDSGSYKVGISIGVSFCDGSQTPYETFKEAEIACSVTKAKGGEGQIHFFDSLDQDSASQRNAPMWAMKINDAIMNDDLVLFYQPIEPTSDQNNGKRKCEILLRIKEDNGRILAPGQFIAAAERFNLMPQVDRAVIRKSFEWLAQNPHIWDTQVISINLSGTTLNSDGLVGYVEQLMQTYRIPPHTVCFEVTETAALTNENHALELLHELRRRGFAFSLDDFGSGFASYGYLRRLPVDYVKIDGCFVKNLATDSKDYAIVKSIHDVCRVMGIETVAEFVEDQETLERLRQIGVTYAQGYGIGRPKDLSTYEPLGSVEDLLLRPFEE